MPQVIPFVLATVGYTAAALVGASISYGAALALGGALLVAGTFAAKKVMDLFEVEMPKIDTDRSRQATVKSTTEPYKIIYGQTLVSGPIAFVGTANTDNKDLYYAIALAGHEVNDITDMHFDDVVIPDSEIGGGSSSGGNVTGSGIFGPKNSKTIVKINKYLGTSTQAADSDLVAAFTGWTSAHQGKGIAYIVTKWTLDEDSQETWDKYTPQNIKALVQGKKLYDPRLEYAAVSTYGQDITNASYIAYGDNPALCLVDYLINADYGMGIAASKIDWPAVVTAANGCDVSVSVPGGSQSRFTCNGVLFGTDSHRTNINKLLSSMNGMLSYVNGKYVMRAGIYEAPAISLNEDDLISGLSIKTSLERGDRFNTIKGVFIDPSQNYKSTEFPEVQLADAVTRDNGEVLDKEIALNMTNSSYMAQRISNKLIQLSDQQKVVTFPANLSAMRVAVGDRVQVSIDELSWSNKVFQCLGWTFSEEGGVNLTLREDSSTSYADPAVGDYSTITATGDITPGFRGVPSPSGLSATAGLKNVELDWVNPPNNKDYESIYVYASPNGNFSSAVKIGETDGTQFVHDFANGIDAVSPGDTRYYWVRAIKYQGTSAEARSNLEPNADPNTTVFATVGRVEWSDVSGSTNAPEDNATVGATVGTDLYDTDGTTVLGQSDVLNSILAQDILLVETEAGDVLDLETGADVDIQNLGDVAIYVSDQNAILNSSITSVSNSLSSLQDVVVDLTTGVSDIYIQTSAPVAGVGGIPDPIPDFSRWYDSDDNNHPYYWDSTQWVSLKDGEIAQNASAITSLQSSLSTTNSNVTTNASAISALDTTVTSLNGTVTSISSDVTALENTVNDASTGVAANASGLSSLTTRVTAAEGTITSHTSDITTLQSDLTTAEGNITTNATGISGLTTRVTTAEGNITTNASDITALESTVNDASTGVAATASGLSALTTRVTTAENDIDSNSSAVTTLDASFTQDVNYRTKVADESANLLTTEGDVDVELEELTDFVSGSSAAVQALDVRTTASEDNITSQSSQITALESTVNDPTTGVDATATGLSSLTTRVTTAEGTITSQSSSITALQSDLDLAELTVAANASAVSSLDTRVTSAEGTITSQSTSITNLESGLTTAQSGVTTNSSAISALDTRVTSAEGTITSQSSDITTLQSGLTTANSNISSNSTAVSSLDTRVTSAEGSITSISADVTTLQSDLTTAEGNISTNSTALSSLTTRVTSAEGSITSQAADITTLQSDLTSAETDISGNATAISGIDTRVTSAEGSITSISSSLTSLSTTVGSNTTSISTQATSINGLEAQYTVKIDNNDRIAGFGLASTSATGTPTSEFVVIADKFSVVDPLSTSDTPIVPFSVTSGNIYMGTNVVISGSLITTGTISADRINIDGVTLDTSGGQLIIAGGGVDTNQIALNAVSGIEVDFNSSTTATTINAANNPTYNSSTDEASVTIVTEGGPIDLFASFEFAASTYYTNTYTAVQLWLWRKTGATYTLIYYTYNPYMDKNLGLQLGVSYLDQPAAGTHTYIMQIGRVPSYNVYGRFPYLRALELKR